MARTRAQQDDQSDQVAQVIEGQDDNFGAAPAPDDTAAMDVWAPAPSQWRRRLTPPELLDWLSSHVYRTETDDETAMLEMFGRAVKAETIDQVLTGAELEKGREMPDCILAIDEIEFTPSDQPKGFPFYARLFGKRTDTGEAVSISVGGAVVMGQLAFMHYLCERLPVGSPFVVPEDSRGSLAPDSYPIYFRIKQTPPNAEGNRTNLLIHPTRGTAI